MGTGAWRSALSAPLWAAAKRRNFVEADETATRVEMEGGAKDRNGTKGSDKIV
jgi:hypothetical protein